MKKMITAVCVGLVACTLSGCAFLPQEEELPRAPVVTGQQGQDALQQCTVTRGDINYTITTRATYSATDEEELRFAEKGLKVAKVYHTVGDEVKKGDLIAELVCDDVNDEIESQTADIAEQERAFSYFTKERQLTLREEKLTLSQLTPDSDEYISYVAYMKDTDSDYQKQCAFYEEEIRLAKSKLTALQEKLAARQIVAGMDGTLRYIMPISEEEDTIYDGKTLFAAIADYSSGVFTATVDKESYYNLDEICEMNVNQSTIEVKVVSIEPNNTGTKYYVSFAPIIPSADLRSDDSGEVTKVVDSRKNVLCLPAACVHITPTVQYVILLDENGVKTQKSIGVGLVTNTMAEIVSGLSEGDVVLK